MPPSKPEHYFLIHDLSGTQDGPFNKKQAHQLIFKRKIKRGSKIAVAGRDGMYYAKDLFANAFEIADQRRAEEAEAAKEKKRNAKAVAKQEKAEAKREAEPPTLSEPNVWKSPLKSEVQDDEKDKYWGFAFQKSVISISIIFVIIAGVISLGLSVVVFINTGNNTSIGIGSRLLMLFSQLLATAIGTLFAVGSLLFFRNLIDWMIDVERNTRP